MEYAPYLTIDDKPVGYGSPYWTVHKESLRLCKNLAGNENNVGHQEYFLDEESARVYVVTHAKLFTLKDLPNNYLMENYLKVTGILNEAKKNLEIIDNSFLFHYAEKHCREKSNQGKIN
jgi:hypothetical protein